ncbi:MULTISPECIES: SUKH-4 family immunity protein [Streptomyces]|uniref:SUKH-4 family immunity protein n=1 Tax=Streptomyces TaxID=1883 RepID=UPI000690226D|nr:SUKH-4 family immunity protein [Streptomyces durhamensis]
MSPLIDRTRMESVFSADDLVALDDGVLAAIAHEPTRVFLREVGLPDQVGWFEMDQFLLDGDLRIGGEAWQAVAEKYPNRSFDMSAWLTLGGIALDDLIVDTATGIVYCIPEDGAPHLLNSSIDALAYFLHALEEERPEYDAYASTDEGVDPEGAADRLLHRMRQADPVAMENPESCWFAVLRHVRNLLRD